MKELKAVSENKEPAKPVRFFRNAVFSLKCLWNGLLYIKDNDWTWKYIAAAILVNIVVTLFSVIIAFLVLRGVFSWLQGVVGLSGVFLNIFFFLVSIIAALIFTGVIFKSISNIINSIFYSPMVAKLLAKKGYVPEREVGVVEDLQRSIIFEIKKFIVMGVIGLLSSILHIIPIIGSVIFVLLNTIQVVLIGGVDSFEPTLALQKLKFREKLKLVLLTPDISWPFLLVTGFINSVPVLNIVTIPISMVGATLLFSEKLRDKFQNAEAS